MQGRAEMLRIARVRQDLARKRREGVDRREKEQEGGGGGAGWGGVGW